MPNTPGPWRVSPAFSQQVLTLQGLLVGVAVRGEAADHQPTVDSNAALMASAPMLLEALQRLTSALNDECAELNYETVMAWQDARLILERGRF